MDNPELKIETTIFDKTDERFDSFLQELDSNRTPPIIGIDWIQERLDFTENDLRRLKEKGIIPRGNVLNHTQGKVLGYTWYNHQKGLPWDKAIRRARNFLEGNLSLKPL